MNKDKQSKTRQYDICNKSILSKNLARHLRQVHPNSIPPRLTANKVKCEECNLYINKENWESHIKSKTHKEHRMVKESLLKQQLALLKANQNQNRASTSSMQTQLVPKTMRCRSSISSEVFEKIKKLEGVEVFKQFGKSNQPVTIQLRILKETKNLDGYDEKLKEVIAQLE